MSAIHRTILLAARDSLGLALLLTLLVDLVSDSGTLTERARLCGEIFTFAFLIMASAEVVFGYLEGRTASFQNYEQWAIFVFVMALICAAGSLLGSAILAALGAEPFFAILKISLKASLFLGLVLGINQAAYARLQGRLHNAELQLRTKELEREQALKLVAEARLGALEARVHPHFLFNTLNSISALIPQDPVRAERLVGRLASLLRFSLDKHGSGLVSWEQELKIVRDYLDIEQTRLGPRLRYRVDSDEDLKATRLPAHAVQLLVENSVKHAISPEREGGEIRLEARRAGSTAVFEVSDNGAGFTVEDVSPGHGIDNLRSRLAGLFGEAANVSVERNAGWTVVRLKVPA